MTRKTITEALFAAAGENQRGIQFLHGDDHKEWLGYADILDRSRRAAAHLRRCGVTAGSYVPVILPTGPSFVTAFYGILLAGAIPCPMSIPTGFGSVEAFVERVVATCQYIAARHAATTQAMRGIAASNALLLDYQDPRSSAATVRAAYTSEQGKLEVELFAAMRLVGRDYLVRPLVSWHPTDAVTLQAGLEAYGGDRARPLGALHPFSGAFMQTTFAF